VVAAIRDITARRQLEAQLQQVQKMEAVGRLAGGVAHDFNNILGVILGHSQILLSGMSPADPQRARVEQILSASERAAMLTRQLLAFSRKQVLESRVIDLNGLIEALIKMLGRLIGEDVELTFRRSASAGRVRADPTQIEQVLMNLAVNARDAMPGGGRLAIETFDAEIDEDYARVHAGATPGRYVGIAVSDTGHGMTREIQEHIFEPFFTTKAPGKGTGLLIAELLEENGYHVLVAEDAAKAIEIAERHEGAIHLLLTDVVMPRMHGHDLARRVKERRPDVRVLYMSGYTQDAIAQRGEIEEDALLISKPFTQEALTQKLREALGPQSP
jgi:signal transduction histidine kinase